MRRGTTPTIDIHISGIEPADVVRAYVTLKQEDRIWQQRNF